MCLSSALSFGSIRARTPHCEPGQRIGLLGGSFNPAHDAHLLISQIAIRRLGLDRVWWLVTPGNPLKEKSELAPLTTRVTTARAIAKDNHIIVTDFEQCLPTAYTAATLAFLHRRHPRTRFVWLMGADNLIGFHRWQNWRTIFETLPVAVIDRPGCHLRALSAPAARTQADRQRSEAQSGMLLTRRTPAWTFLTGPLSATSSTAIRGLHAEIVAKTQQK